MKADDDFGSPLRFCDASMTFESQAIRNDLLWAQRKLNPRETFPSCPRRMLTPYLQQPGE